MSIYERARWLKCNENNHKEVIKKYLENKDERIIKWLLEKVLEKLDYEIKNQEEKLVMEQFFSRDTTKVKEKLKQTEEDFRFVNSLLQEYVNYVIFNDVNLSEYLKCIL